MDKTDQKFSLILQIDLCLSL